MWWRRRGLRWLLVLALLLVARHALFVSFTDRVEFHQVEERPFTSGLTTVDCTPILHGGHDPDAYAGTVLDDDRCERPATIRRIVIGASLLGAAVVAFGPPVRRRRTNGSPLSGTEF